MKPRPKTFAALLGLVAMTGASGADLPWLLDLVAPGPVVAGGPRVRPGFRTALTVAIRAPGAAAAWRPGDRWRVPLPDGSTAVLQVGDCRSIDPGVLHVRGCLEGEAGSEAVLTFVGTRMAGVVRRGTGDVLVIQPVGDSRHEMAQPDADTGPRCGNAGGAEPPGSPRPATKEQRESQGAGRLMASTAATTNVVDLALLHTPAAEIAAGGPAGMRALLELAVVEANDAFARSGARVTQLRPVCWGAVDYTESGDLATDLLRLMRPEDGWLDEVTGLRNHHAADVVCLVVESEDSNQYAGQANQLTSTDPARVEQGFTVCLRPYLLGNYTLPHEVGHLMGCNHDRENAPVGGLHPWSYGTRIQVGDRSYRTVMAYRPGLQFPHFSNPWILFQGVPTGVDGVADNVRTLNLTAPLVAAAREPPGRIGFSHADLSVGEASGTVRLDVVRSGDLSAAEVTVLALPSSAREGIDFAAPRNRFALAAGAARVEVPLQVFDNAVADGPRRFAVALSEPSDGFAVGPVGAVVVTLTDDETEEAAVLDTSFRARPGADQEVRSLAVLSGGDVIAGGGFASFNGTVRSRLARVRPDGTEDGAFGPQVKYRVNAATVLADGRVALGGEFNTVDGERRNHVALLLPDGRLDPGFQFEIGTDYPVNALAPWPAGGVVIGGSFTSVHGSPALRVARLRLDGSPDPAFDTRAGPDAEVLALFVDAEGRTVVGGRFRRVGSLVRGGIARLNRAGGLDLSFAGGAGAEGVVQALAPDREGRVLVAGEFTRFDNRPAGRVVRLLADGRPDPAFDAGSGPDDAVLALLAADDGAVWIAGRFTRVDGRRRNRVARLAADGSLDGTFDPGIGPNDWVLALAPWRAEGVLVGGVFDEVNGVPRGGVAALWGRLPPSPRFTRVGAVPGGLEWEAVVWPRQNYDLLRSPDLRDWSVQAEASAPDGRAEGVASVEPSGPGFVRLRRRLE